MLALLVIAVTRSRTAKVPDIPTASLEPSVAALIQQQTAAVHSSPRSGAAWGKLGSILKSFGYREQAAQCLAEAERLAPKEPRWPYLQAMLRLRDALPFALEKLRRTVQLCGNEPETPRLRLAQLLAEMGRDAEAQLELEALLRAKPGSAPAQLLLAQIRQSRGEWNEAAALATNCTANPYTARTAWTLLAALHRRAGDTNAANQASRRATTAAPEAAWPDPFEEELLVWRKDARSLSDRAQNYLLAGRPADALPLVRQLESEHPNFAETWLLLGRTYYLQNEPLAAEKALRRFLEMDAASVNGRFQLGMSLLAQNRFEEAARLFAEAAALKPDLGPAFFNLGFALAKSGRQREAVSAFQECLRQSPEKIDAYILLADLHLQLNEPAKAAELATLAERLNPADPRLSVLRRKIEQR